MIQRPNTLIIASRNRHKAGEIEAILGSGARCLTLNEFPEAPPLIEDASTFAGNAARKATQLAQWLGGSPSRAPDLPPDSLILADDSGLEVDALDGAPGVYSARFAALESGRAGNSSDAENNARLLELLGDLPLERRTARFRCVLALASVNSVGAAGDPHLFEGACEGRILFAPKGRGGFGYDPLFVPNGFTESFAELGESVKNRISHRACALARLREWLAQGVRDY